MNGEDPTIRIHPEGVPGIRCPFSFFDGHGTSGSFAGMPSVANFMPESVGNGLRNVRRGKRKGQLWKQPTVNDCLPYEKEVVVGVFVSGARSVNLTAVDDVKLHTCCTESDTAFVSGFDLKDPGFFLKRLPIADSNQNTN
jgi:hypothetical protein